MLRHSRFIASVITVTFFWGSVWTPGLVSSAFAQSDKGNLPFLAVVGFRTVETSAESFLRSELSDEFGKSSRVRMVPESLTNQVVDDIWTEDKSTSKQLIKEASSSFSEGKKFYSQLSMEDAINSFNKSVVAYREGIGALRDNRYLLISHLYLGMALMVLGRKQEGENFIREMIVLDSNRSQRKLSQTEFPPEVIQVHRNLTKQVLAAPTGNLVINFKPAGAKVYVDAVIQEGKDSVSMDLPVGEHFVVIEKKGFRQFSKRILIKPGSNPMDVALEEWQLLSPYSLERRNNLLATEDLFKLASDLSANILLLGNITPLTGGRSSVSGQLFDVRTKEFSHIEKMEVADAELQSSGRKMAKKLLDNMTHAGSVLADVGRTPDTAAISKNSVSKQTVASPIVKEKSKPSEAIYQKWWFWTLVGVAAAGAGGFLLLGTKKEPSFHLIEIDNPL